MSTSNSQRLFCESREQLCNCQGQICNNESLKTGDILGGFEVLATENIEDVSSTGIYLKHKKTGLEVFHLYNDDSENLFAFSFATPSLLLALRTLWNTACFVVLKNTHSKTLFFA